MEVVGENFKVAWELLEKRYGNKRRRLESHLETLINLNQIRPRNAQDISDLLDTVLHTVRALETLGCDTAHYNHWLVHCIVRKLDAHQGNLDNLAGIKGRILPLLRSRFVSRKSYGFSRFREGLP